jgi:hypothetical protein
MHFSSRVAEGLARRSHGNPDPERGVGCQLLPRMVADGDNLRRDERGYRPREPLLIQSDEEGFFVGGRRSEG